MSLDGLNVLDGKIDKLLNELKFMREENAKNSDKIKQNEEKITILEKENKKLNSQASGAVQTTSEDKKKIELASEKVKTLLDKLELIN